jgi:hypothetical protein
MVNVHNAIKVIIWVMIKIVTHVLKIVYFVIIYNIVIPVSMDIM